MLMRMAVTMVVVLGWASGLAAAGQEPDRARVDRGREVYKQQRCATCHSIDGAGNRRNPLDGVGSRMSAEDIRKWIVVPQEMDPKVRKRAYDKLPKADVDALVAYLQSLKASPPAP